MIGSYASATATGMQRREAAIGRLRRELDALAPHSSPAGARITIAAPRANYPPVWDALQGFARPLWAMGALARAGDGECLERAIWRRWRHGLIAGSDPDHKEYWGPCEDRCQAFCEMPPIALALLWARQELWEPLSPRQRGQLTDWLGQILHRRVHDNNWRWFRVLVASALEELNGADHGAIIAAELDALEQHAGDDGWYLDGRCTDRRCADWYIANAYHCYGLLVAERIADRWPERTARLQRRARRFAEDLQFLHAADGAPILWGRSLCYRDATASFWAAAGLTDTAVLPWPQVASCWRRQQDWWQRHDLRRADGTLDLGCTYPNPSITEAYIAATSPYWNLKGLLGLAQPAGHPFWSASAASPPRRTSPRPLATAGGLLAGNTADPLLLLVGQWAPPYLSPACYDRFAYSPHHAFAFHRQADGLPACDNNLVLLEPDRPADEQPVPRRVPEEWSVAADHVRLVWWPQPWARVTTILRPTATGYHRHHRLKLQRPCLALEGGFPCSPGRVTQSDRHIAIDAGDLQTRLDSLDGRRLACGPVTREAHLLLRESLTPYLLADLPAGEHELRSTASRSVGA